MNESEEIRVDPVGDVRELVNKSPSQFVRYMIAFDVPAPGRLRARPMLTSSPWKSAVYFSNAACKPETAWSVVTTALAM